MHEAPLRIVTPAWWRLVVRPDKTIDRRAYTFCALQAMHAAFKRRDLFVMPSQRWGDPRAQLLTAEAWQAQRTQVCRMLGLHEQPAPALERLAQELDAAYRRTADNLPTNEAVHIERVHGRHELVLSGLDKLDEPPSLLALKTLVAQRLPRVELPELLLEVQAWTGFASDFTHVNEHGARADDLPISVCAALLAEARNVGLEPLVRPEVPALTRARLAWIQQNYLRTDTITNANARLVDAHAALPLTKALGSTELASADGLRFVVPVRSVHAAANPRYFGRGKGVTYINYTSTTPRARGSLPAECASDLLVLPRKRRGVFFLAEELSGGTERSDGLTTSVSRAASSCTEARNTRRSGGRHTDRVDRAAVAASRAGTLDRRRVWHLERARLGLHNSGSSSGGTVWLTFEQVIAGGLDAFAGRRTARPRAPGGNTRRTTPARLPRPSSGSSTGAPCTAAPSRDSAGTKRQEIAPRPSTYYRTCVLKVRVEWVRWVTASS